jgi:hypothetical protein
MGRKQEGSAHILRLALLAGLLLAGCAAGDARFTAPEPAGFFFGLWHGFISFITLIWGIFSDDVQVYERMNTGGWYDFGFLLGVACTWGSGQHSHRKWKGWRESCEDLPPKGHLKVDVSWSRDDEDDPEVHEES